MTFSVKQLRFTFILDPANPARFQGNNNTLQITGLRATADIDYVIGPPSFPTANVRIYGMKPSDMTALTGLTFGVLTYTRASMQIEANPGNGWTTVFVGQLITSVPDFAQMPDVAFQITAQSLGFDLLNPATPTSFPGSASFDQVFRTIVLKTNQNFANEGVSGSFPAATYFPGTPADQLRDAAKKAGIVYYTGDVSGLTSIGLPGVPRNLPKFVLTPQNGLIGYPSLDSVNLIGVMSEYNPGFRFGAPLQIQGSQQLGANGDWMIYDCKHSLSSLMPNGPWFSKMTAQPPVGFGLQP